MLLDQFSPSFVRIYCLAALGAGEKFHVGERIRGEVVVNLSPLVTTLINWKFLVQYIINWWFSESERI